MSAHIVRHRQVQGPRAPWRVITGTSVAMCGMSPRSPAAQTQLYSTQAREAFPATLQLPPKAYGQLCQASHRVGEIRLQAKPEEAEGNHRHDADSRGEHDGEPHGGLGQGVLGIPWGTGVTKLTEEIVSLPVVISDESASSTSKPKPPLTSPFFLCLSLSLNLSLVSNSLPKLQSCFLNCLSEIIAKLVCPSNGLSPLPQICSVPFPAREVIHSSRLKPQCPPYCSFLHTPLPRSLKNPTFTEFQDPISPT